MWDILRILLLTLSELGSHLGSLAEEGHHLIFSIVLRKACRGGGHIRGTTCKTIVRTQGRGDQALGHNNSSKCEQFMNIF